MISIGEERRMKEKEIMQELNKKERTDGKKNGEQKFLLQNIQKKKTKNDAKERKKKLNA